ncbi:MAG: AraC family transcriptional regulator, partial [Bacteroidia bacterium]
MEFTTHLPHLLIAPFIESVFHFKHFQPDHSIERVVPTGHVFIIFELDGKPRNTFENDSLVPNATYTQVWISGMHRNYISISAHPDSEMFVIQFKPDGAYPFFHFPIAELNEKIVPAEEVLGEDILTLRDEMLVVDTTEAKFALAEQWLMSRFDQEKLPPNDLHDLVRKIQEDATCSCQEIVHDYPKTQKHLIDLFKRYVGLTPKYYHRIVRFNEMLQLIQKNQQIRWAQIAYQCGYADQSHFIREFKHFSGFNPQ